MALKDELPLTAKFVAEKRKEWGDAHVTAMLRAAMAGERGCCYTVERIAPDQYRTFGKPFDWSAPDAELLGRCVVLGLEFAGLMRPPAKGTQAAQQSPPQGAKPTNQGGSRHGTH